jgi:hypothetical protein
MPFSAGNVRAGHVSLQATVPAFESPVDIYLGIYAPSYSTDEIFIIGQDGTLHPLNAEGLRPWKSGVAEPVSARFFGDIPVSDLKPGEYTLYTLVIKEGANIEDTPFYLWSTTFDIGK